MASDQESNEIPEQGGHSASTSPPPRRGRRRSGRGRRGRGRRPPSQHHAETPQSGESESAPPAQDVEAGAPVAAPSPVIEPPMSAVREAKRASPMSVQQAIEEVNRVIDLLRESLEDMEEVLETLELAERQKNADEHEIETLRRSLRHMHRPREGGHTSHGHSGEGH